MLIVDETLPASLASRLGEPAVPATSLGMRLTDDQLWQHAKVPGGVILTKDADFFDRLSLEGPPPQVVWVRVGNLRRAALEEVIVRWWPEVRGLLKASTLVELHNDRLEALALGKAGLQAPEPPSP